LLLAIVFLYFSTVTLAYGASAGSEHLKIIRAGFFCILADFPVASEQHQKY